LKRAAAPVPSITPDSAALPARVEMTVALVTVRVAEELWAEPAALVATTRKVSPFRPEATLGIVSVAVPEPVKVPSSARST